MSLINEALKKAQKMRQVEPAAEGAAEPGEAGHAPRVAKRRPAVQAKNVVIATGCVVIAFAIAGAGAFMFLLPDTTPPEIVHRPAAKAVTPAATPKVDAVPTVSAPDFLSPAELASQEEGAPSGGATADGSSSNEAAAAAPTTGNADGAVAAVTTTPVAPPAPARPQPVENMRVYDFLDTLRVTGIRASATDPKVLMNDRVFRLNDIVDRTLGLRITGISPEALTFTDETGFEYRKSF